MIGTRTILAAIAAVAAIGAAGLPAGASAQQGGATHERRADCAGPAPTGYAHCHAHVIVDPDGQVHSAAAPAGYGPSDLRSAYALPPSTTAATVAVVDAYDDPNAESDLATYRSAFGLAACTTANGCFSKVNQQGVQGSYPTPNSSWAGEISLDVDMVSAICPTCHILLVEASSNSLADLGAAVDTAAATAGVVAISNSYGGGEFSGELSFDAHYTHTGVAVTASSGDSGFGSQYPAASPAVTAVGGTSLTQDTTTVRGWSETAWSGAGSGCSAYEAQPSWQASTGHTSACSRRQIADVSAVADPNTGVAVYQTYGASGWTVYGGTSVASPIIASVYALSGNTAGPGASYAYAHSGALNDVTSGSNASNRRQLRACGNSYLCNAGPGYDGPTGLGTPSGTGAF